MTSYRGKALADYTLWELGDILRTLTEAEAKREEASKHSKFNTDTEANGKIVKKQEFPPPNPEFLKLKSAVELEIKERNKR